MKNILLCIAAIGLTVSGCATQTEPESQRHTSALSGRSGDSQINSEAGAKAALESGLTPSQVLIRSGVDFLLKGELEKAQTVFNTALKFDFNNPHLHFLNALAYHQGFVGGESDSFALARSGYRTALLQDPSLEGIAHFQLGRLFLDAKDYASSKQAFSLAVAENYQYTEALYGLAQAAAFEGDMATSYWAASELDRVKWGSPLLSRLKAVHAALAQQPQRARALAADYANSTDDRGDAKYVQDRVNQLLAMKTSFTEGAASQSGERSRGPVLLAQSTSPPTGGASEPESKPEAQDDPASTVGKAPQVQKWFRCDDAPGIVSRPAVNIGGSGANDESITLAPLPGPCPGEMPRTAIIEVSMIQTQETKGKNLGINLLEGLAAIFSLQRARTFTQSTDVAEEIRTSSLVIANTVENSMDVLRYSLNIANAAHTRNEVLARPTLAALDRVPAVFFAGATITLGIAGVGGGASTVVDKPVGISLTVTPTFVDDDNVLVSMRATRSFIETNLTPASSSVLLQQSRHSINASSKLKFGETFVVNGLVSKQNLLSESGTPVLQDIPVLQYLFKRSVKTDISLQILTLITIRRPPDSEADADKAKTKPGVSTHKLSRTVNEFVELQSIPPVIDEILASFKADNQLYRQLREKDLLHQSAASRSRLESTLDDFKEMIYF